MALHLTTHLIRQLRVAAPQLGRRWSESDQIVPSIPAIWQCDLATEELSWSGGVFDLFGIARGTKMDRRATLQLYAPESRERLERLRQTAIDTGGSFTFEAQITRPTGEPRWMRLCADVQRKNGRSVILYGTKQDITAEMAR